MDLMSHAYRIRQLLVSNEKVIFVTQRGRVGQCDKKLGSLNVNYALVDVNTVVPVNPTDVSNRVEIQAESVVMGESKKDELSWVVEPRQEPGNVLYKISLYRDKLFVGDAHTAVTTLTKMTLPSELLQSWSSAQRFDVSIAGITTWMSFNTSKIGLQAPLKPPTAPTNVRLYATQQDDGTTQGGPVGSTITHISFEVKSGKVECSVAAANEPNNIGEFTPKISIDSSELKPLVRLFAIDSTNALIAITNVTQDEPVSKREKRQISHVNRVSIGGDVSRVDTMTSDWVGHRLLLVSGQALYQLPLDAFLTTSLLTPRKLIELSTGATDAKQLTFDPFKNTAYLLTRNGSLFLLNLARSHEKNLALAVPCLTSQTVTWMMTEFAWNRASSPKIYALTWNGLIVIDVEENNKCNEVRIDWNKFGEKGLKAMSAFAIADKLFVFVTSSEMLIYGRETVVPIPITYPPLRQILAVYFTRKNTDKVKHIRSYTEKIHVENGILDKETDYEVTVAWLNRYSDASGISDPKSFRTGFGYPSAPRSLQAVAVTPDTVYLYWNLPETLNAPIAEIKYKISQQASGLASPSSIAVQEYSDGAFSPTTSDSASCLVSPCRAKIANLRPATDYKFWATSIHKSHLNSQFLEDAEAISQEASARTKDIPGTLRPDNVTGSSLLLRWNSLQAEQPPTVISVQYKETGATSGWKSPSNASFDPSVSTILVLINGLLSATSYDYRFVAAYSGTFTIENRAIGFKEYYYQGVQQAKTKAGVPTAPVQVEARMDEEGWIVSWKEPSSDGGSPITSYAVEMRHNRSAEWEIAERGLDGWKLWWRPAKSDRRQTWEFRVRAANLEGFGAYGYSSDTVVRARARAARLKKERNLDKNCITLEKIAGLDHTPCQPMPLEMLNEIKNLPHVRCDNVRLEKKLGTGSFGEVWEGVATRLPMRDQETRVAIKTLRQGYEESEKIRFMKEAILMNNFDHPNIVKLLGVCLEGPKEYLILELMEGGDLLNFLKASSPTDSFPSQLSLRDVLSMLIDIGRGGAYLESIRHVHRDLAARNCLISSRTPRSHRVTKIGALRFPPDHHDIIFSEEGADFGLARGVHNSEYYRVRGEDFLPLRWLAPECIMDGLFSSKSDIWAFGILMYEIVSLGQKPYLNMDNNQVLTHVRNGGTPAKPVYCPDPL
ncbi:fibronectin type III domain protein [Teladorsagia circumcincta]|uniref:receptor protein-tyrosine kinase n=1 Tax=Teladorsagia circumcincta TaxID=45464 RepID=A0A2G9V4R8_TELCI|nr:fibronectin type III domain protein [Teladorsagia circumcincta]